MESYIKQKLKTFLINFRLGEDDDESLVSGERRDNREV